MYVSIQLFNTAVNAIVQTGANLVIFRLKTSTMFAKFEKLVKDAVFVTYSLWRKQ